jgi:hypothetical protein
MSVDCSLRLPVTCKHHRLGFKTTPPHHRPTVACPVGRATAPSPSLSAARVSPKELPHAWGAQSTQRSLCAGANPPRRLHPRRVCLSTCGRAHALGNPAHQEVQRTATVHSRSSLLLDAERPQQLPAQWNDHPLTAPTGARTVSLNVTGSPWVAIRTVFTRSWRGFVAGVR